jgi:hypothetical protein
MKPLLAALFVAPLAVGKVLPAVRDVVGSDKSA